MKLNVTLDMLKKNRKIIVKGIINGKKVVAKSGTVEDWAAYIQPTREYYDGKVNWTYDRVAASGWKLRTSELSEYFNISPSVRKRYRK